MLTTCLTSKGQVTIPAPLRAALGLGIGDQVDFKQVGDSLILRRHENNIAASFGILKTQKRISLADMERAIEEGATE